jgi:hypothetical protein
MKWKTIYLYFLLVIIIGALFWLQYENPINKSGKKIIGIYGTNTNTSEIIELFDPDNYHIVTGSDLDYLNNFDLVFFSDNNNLSIQDQIKSNLLSSVDLITRLIKIVKPGTKFINL